MSNRHKYAELIHAWAEGAQIQRRQEINKYWEDCITPTWSDHNEYRIKPEELILKYRNYLTKDSIGCYKIKVYDYTTPPPEKDSDFVCWLWFGWKTHKVELK